LGLSSITGINAFQPLELPLASRQFGSKQPDDSVDLNQSLHQPLFRHRID
jgi:hypothetical protein